MKRIKHYLAFCVMFALLLAGCSKDSPTEVVVDDPSSDNLATLTIGASLNDILNLNRAHLIDDLPACSDDIPVLASIILRPGNKENMDVSNDIVLDIEIVAEDYNNDNEVDYFTVYEEALKLPAGTYTLRRFYVYSDEDKDQEDLIWIAPFDDGAGEGTLSEFVDNPLPLEFNLFDGEKRYVDVEVLCYDQRDVNEYGYVFFDIIPEEAIQFCMFLNYCTDAGRHYVGSYSVDVWRWNSDTESVGAVLYTDEENMVSGSGETASAEPLCFILPDEPGTDNDLDEEFYFEITLLSDTPGYDGDDKLIFTGVYSVAEIKARFGTDDQGIDDGTLEYLHFQYNCGIAPPPPFEEPGDTSEKYKACIKSLGDGETVGFAYFKIENNILNSTVVAANLESGETYTQHIHENADCDSYGGVLLALNYPDNSWPQAITGGFLNYQRDFPSYNATLKSTLDPLDDRTVVLHDDEGPIGCGELNEY
ncbi:hypothetical protein [Gramella sp. MAR_2010_147]|uniref:hypothetical protein n=1 Tax=Gramella sp. MAR_2010_147 TaxID=1250205 RepID=UPI00087AEE2E|nr:hypothetical protein [Gramella sp. MAR_2010_147]SDR68792.1 hypothetical protein SAMN04488553_0289 [Gramella sp. MAR_2010_147]